MKKLLLITCLLLGINAIAQEGNEQERLDQVPPPVTERQVEKDARVAQLERKRNEDAAKKEQDERMAALQQQNNQDVKKPKDTSTRKSSNTKEKQ